MLVTCIKYKQMFVKLIEIIIQKLHKVNIRQRSFITTFKIGEQV